MYLFMTGLQITDEDANPDEIKHPLTVARISAIGPLNRLKDNDKNEDIFFTCILKGFSREFSANPLKYFVSSAFQTGIVFASTLDYVYELETNVVLQQYILISPEFVLLEQRYLEEQYVLTRRRISTYLIWFAMIENNAGLSFKKAHDEKQGKVIFIY